MWAFPGSAELWEEGERNGVALDGGGGTTAVYKEKMHVLLMEGGSSETVLHVLVVDPFYSRVRAKIPPGNWDCSLGRNTPVVLPDLSSGVILFSLCLRRRP